MGTNTSITISEAKTTAERTSSEAASTTANAGLGSTASRFSRSRRAIFSTSMIASSTTSPSAMTRPAIIITLIVAPDQSSIRPAPSSDSGIATRLIVACRQSRVKRNSTAATSAQPIISARVRLSIERSMKVAGRKMVVSTFTSLRPGFSSANAASTARVSSSVLAVGCFSTISMMPGPSSMMALPIGALKPSTTRATSPILTGASPACLTTACASSAAVCTVPVCWTARRWLGVSTNPPPPTSTASPAAARTSASVTPAARRRSGSTSTCNCLSRWPHTATFATPGTAISRGRMVQRTSSDNCIWSSFVDDSPTFIARLVDDSGGISTG